MLSSYRQNKAEVSKMKSSKKIFAGMFPGGNPSAATIVTTAASVAASAMVVRSITQELIPHELRHYVYSTISDFARSFSPEVILVIEEFAGIGTNQIYKAAETYIGEKIAPSTNMFTVSMAEKESKVSTSMAKNQEVFDNFNGVTFKWQKFTRKSAGSKSFRRQPGPSPGGDDSEGRYFQLHFHKKHKKLVFDSYFPFILNESKNLNQVMKTIKIHTLAIDPMRRYSGDSHTWQAMKLEHPATFETLALDTELKKMIIDDLDRFVRRRDFYREIGKIWKRGYLLYGPPGTGKSSLIAAMANHLNFDVYDLELTDIQANSDLRRLLINTGNRSILVVEDIDCSLDLENERKADEQALKVLRSKTAQTVNIIRRDKPQRSVTLSGLLNFIDGLWSSVGDERIIIVTTNHKENLDPALLRPGRMDMHIHMSYFTPCAFKILAKNYLKITHHSFFDEISALIEEILVTPAEVGEQLLRNEDADGALADLIDFMEWKRKEKEEEEAKKLQEEMKEGENEESDDVQNQETNSIHNSSMQGKKEKKEEGNERS